MDNIYKIPLEYERQNVASVVLNHFRLPDADGDLSNLKKISNYLETGHPKINIAVVGKYFNVPDAYKSLFEALFHAGIANDARVEIHKIDAESLENKTDGEIKNILSAMDGIIVPGGFGERGVPGKIAAAKFARENNVPYLGICLGMQVAAIEFLRNVCGINDAYSTEFSKDCTPVISLAAEWEKDGATELRTENADKGGTLRLGAYPAKISDGTLARKIYKSEMISERHRHRYELNTKFADTLAKNGMIISGWSPDGRLPEIVEIPSHKFFIAGQFHPEFNSSPYYSHPLFSAFIAAAR
jgi:CTP synthase